MAARIHMKGTPKRTKYRAKPTTYNGITYHSKMEAARAADLDLMVKSGHVRWWTRQVPFWLGDGLSRYVVDFLVCMADGSVHAEDCKGADTAAWRKHRARWMRQGPIDLWVLRRRGLDEVVEGGNMGGPAAGEDINP